jgi:hypothetical protein
MSTGHKIFTKDNICKSIHFKPEIQTAAGGITKITEKGKIPTYVKGIMTFINVQCPQKTDLLTSFIEDLFNVNKSVNVKRKDTKERNYGGKFKKKK